MDKRRLILMRHAKSDWADEGMSDFERPLSARGRRAAALMGAWLNEGGNRPDLVLCSPAARARETRECAARLLDTQPAVREDEALYLASAETILDVVRASWGTARCMLVIGHNPGMETLAQRLGPPGFADAMITATVAVFDIEPGDAPDTATAVAFLRPRDLV